MSHHPNAIHLMQILADSYALYLKTQNYHWNVTGPNFASLHQLFEMQYTELATAVDDIAERIRALGSEAPGSLAFFNEKQTLTPPLSDASANDMVSDLEENHASLIDSIQALLARDEVAEDEVTATLLSDRLTVHEKTRWMLDASLG